MINKKLKSNEAQIGWWKMEKVTDGTWIVEKEADGVEGEEGSYCFVIREIFEK